MTELYSIEFSIAVFRRVRRSCNYKLNIYIWFCFLIPIKLTWKCKPYNWLFKLKFVYSNRHIYFAFSPALIWISFQCLTNIFQNFQGQVSELFCLRFRSDFWKIFYNPVKLAIYQVRICFRMSDLFSSDRVRVWRQVFFITYGSQLETGG